MTATGVDARVCAECGSTFHRRGSEYPSAHRNRRYCSRACASRANARSRVAARAQPEPPARPRRDPPPRARTAVDTSWHNAGACAAPDVDRELFFHPDGDTSQTREEEARVVCQRCPVVARCLTHALDNRERYGVWGGTTEKERAAILKRRKKAGGR